MPRWTFVALALAGTLACHSTSPSEESFNSSRQRWIDANVVSYSMLITRTDGTGDPVAVRVTVANGAVTSRVFDGTSQDVPAADASKYPDVNALFDLIQDGFNRAQTVTVTFDQTYGFPASMNINYTIGSFDDDLVIAVTEFTAS